MSNGNYNSTSTATINIVNAIEAPSEMGFSVSPNPTSDILTVSNKDYLENDLTVFIYDSQGKKVYEQIGILPVSVENWAYGLYFLQVFSTKKGLIFSQKWVKE